MLDYNSFGDPPLKSERRALTQEHGRRLSVSTSYAVHCWYARVLGALLLGTLANQATLANSPGQPVTALATNATQPSVEAGSQYEIDPAHTFPMFEVRHLGISTHRGRFNRTVGKVSLNPDARSGSIDIVIDTSKIDTGDNRLEAILRGEDFFDTARHPTATFVSRDIEFNAQGLPILARGDLSLRGVKRPLVVNIGDFRCTTFMAIRYVCGADLTAIMKRGEYGITAWRPWVSDEVKLIIQVEAIRQDPPRTNRD
jgi:polyisoprenoid-binding protein YceI